MSLPSELHDRYASAGIRVVLRAGNPGIAVTVVEIKMDSCANMKAQLAVVNLVSREGSGSVRIRII